MNSSHLSERVGPAALLALLPVVGVVAFVLPYAFFADKQAVEPNWMLWVLLLVTGWSVGVVGVIGLLRRNWSAADRQPTWSLVAAAVAGAIGFIASGEATEHWQDLMSLPRPTPLMVALDLTATFLPLLTAACCAWVVLVMVGRTRESAA